MQSSLVFRVGLWLIGAPLFASQGAFAQRVAAPPQSPAQATAAPPVFDCNLNGIQDSMDIASGFSLDCQGDGVPDECQSAVQGTYLHDNLVPLGGVGWGWPSYCWMNQYVIRPGEETITDVELAWGVLPAGVPVTVGIWSDPDGDLDPADAQLLTSVVVHSEQGFTGEIIRVEIPNTMVGPAGTSFFVGAYGEFDPASAPMAYSQGFSSAQSWIIMSSLPIQPNNVTAGAGQVGNLSGNWIMRAISCPSGHCGEITDSNFDGIPDQCQPQDCNANGIEDSVEIAQGTASDCQGDGIPDDCQTDPGSAVYANDSGWSGVTVGTNHDYIAWMNPFIVQPGGETITDVEVAWGYMSPGGEVTVCVWSDPNGDGDPTDAQLIQAFSTSSSFENSGKWVVVNIPDTFVGPAGTSFFVGAYGHYVYDPPNSTVWAASAFDAESVGAMGWYVSADAPIDLNNLSVGAAEFGRLNTVCACDGNWTIRAITCSGGHCLESNDINGNSEPDECEADCDNDGIPDDHEIAIGTASDCNGSGVPDACEFLTDCDSDGNPDDCQAAAPNGLAAAYYASRHLTGDQYSRIDPQVLFDFGSMPAFAPDLPTSIFSVRWTGSLTTRGAGTYTFGALHDDGVRVWVNGKLVIDEWYSSSGPASFDTGIMNLAAGTNYAILVEYFHEDGGALMELHWQPPGGAMQPMLPSDLRPIYDQNQDGVPDGCQLVDDCNENGIEDSHDIFSGIALDCDSNGVPDECQRCEDIDGNGWLDACEVNSGPGLIGQYFRLDAGTQAFSSKVGTRIDGQVDFNWGAGAPLGLNPDRFGVRWTGSMTTPDVSGSYQVSLTVNGHAKLWLDGVLIIDAFIPGTWPHNLTLGASTTHDLRLEYYEDSSDGLVNLSWTVPGGSSTTIPSNALMPSSDANGDGVPDVALADCNMNGVPDALDPDVNGNCIPDDCEAGAGYWRFEEAGGGTALDETANGLDGTLTFQQFRIPEVPVNPIPQTGAPNLQALDNGWTGSMSVPDMGGLLSVPNDSFTLEAWVKLDSLSSPSNSPPNGRKWLFMKKPQASSDNLLEYGFLVQAGDLGSTANELAFRYGDGVNVHSVVSDLEILDYDWHHVSLAYDAARLKLRFGIDGNFQTVAFHKPTIATGGPLLIGAHENAQGLVNQWLFGKLDEPRFTRTFLLPAELLD